MDDDEPGVHIRRSEFEYVILSIYDGPILLLHSVHHQYSVLLSSLGESGIPLPSVDMMS
jgi:hypothetical protein